MPNGGSHEDLSYLTELKPSPHIDLYFLGCQNDRDRWDFQRIYEAIRGDPSILKGDDRTA